MIVASSLVWDRVQADGRRWAREVHVDDTGAEHHVDYLAEVGADVVEDMAARVPGLEAALAEEVAARADAASRETLAAAEDAFFATMTDDELKTALNLPAEFEIPKDG